MQQLVSRLDVAMFNSILRRPSEGVPTDPISDPITNYKVLPVPAGKSSFGAGAQLKNIVSVLQILYHPILSLFDTQVSSLAC